MHIPFRPIARLLTRTLHPSPEFHLSAALPLLQKMQGETDWQGVLVTCNHYSASDFRIWWMVITVSAIFPVDINWLVTSGWTNSGWLTGFTHWLFPRGARLLGFTAMPAMPPDPHQAEQRAQAVRQVLRYANRDPHPVIGISPEGGDQPGGVLGELPAGVGRFMLLISHKCPVILPVGVWKEAGAIQIAFGSPFQLEVPPGLPSGELDTYVGTTVMQHIATLLPERLRGKYG
ncbi:MAG: hypothetical protein C3F13_04220 [Anaerolineales bacterium]|nr:MAG: hypothetical protein C3F13_04220 [Anaerolineales bacterium]